MKIVHTESSDGWGGQEIRILQESEELRRAGHEVMIICRQGGQLEERSLAAGITCRALPMRGAADLSSIMGARAGLKGFDPDVVHCHSSKDHWICGMAARSLGIPVVRSRHISVPLRQRASTRFLYRRLADVIITSGDIIRDLVIRSARCAPDQVVSVPAGVDLSRFDPDRVTDLSPLRRKMGLEAAGPVAGCVGVLRSWKGQHVLIEAAASLAADFQGLKVLLVGDGPQRRNLERKVGEMGLGEVIIFTGHRTDVPDLISLMDVLVLPSTRAEATSQVIPQAWAMGKPVAASAVGGIPEIVVDGVDGILVPPDDPASLAGALARLFSDAALGSRLADAGQRKARSTYSLQRQMATTIDVYRRLVGSRL